MAEAIRPPNLPPPGAAYSHGVRAGESVFVAGEIAQDADGTLVGERDVAEQTRQTILNMEAVLETAGLTLRDVVSTTVYLTSFEHYAEYDRAYAEAFGDHRPARATVQAGLVRPGALVEIQAIALKSGS
jgi:2-iminobutanoate/2-iminopropanoate deaminase